MTIHSDAAAILDPDSGDVAENEAERRHIATLLASVEREAHVSQRMLAAELGVALGLVNLYIKRCVRKGLIKVQEVPSRRYAYYLTPKGFAEKSRLTAEYLLWSLTFFRRARHECAELMREAQARGWRRIALAGGGDLAEIAILSAADQGVHVAALLDATSSGRAILGVPSVTRIEDAAPSPDGWIVTAIDASQDVYDQLVARIGVARVLAPAFLGVRAAKPNE